MLRATVVYGVTILCLPFLLMRSTMRRFSHTGHERFLVIQLGKIGDLICTTPFLRALRSADAQAHITVLCPARTADVLKGNPCVDVILPSDSTSIFSLLLRLFHGNFTTSVSLLPGSLNAVMGLWTAAPRTLHTSGGRMGLAGMFFHFFHTHRLHYAKHTRTYDHYMACADALSIPRIPYAHEWFVSDLERAWARDFLQQKHVEGKFAILSLTAGNRLKEWPLDRFIAVAQSLLERGFDVLFSSAETGVTARAALQFSQNPHITDAGGLSLRNLAAVIERASLFISVDTGPLYIAHALNVPLIDIIGPVDPAEQPPIPSDRVQLVLPPAHIKPTSFVAETLRVSSSEQRKALEETTVEDVLKAVDEVSSHI